MGRLAANIINQQKKDSRQYFLTFADVPFLLDTARVIRMADGTSAVEDPMNMSPKKYQPLQDIIDELDRIIPFQYLDDYGLPSHPGRKLDSLARKEITGPKPNPSIRIGDWFYPNGASRWSVFRGLASEEQVKAMINAVTPPVPVNKLQVRFLGGGGFGGQGLVNIVGNQIPVGPVTMTAGGAGYYSGNPYAFVDGLPGGGSISSIIDPTIQGGKITSANVNQPQQAFQHPGYAWTPQLLRMRVVPSHADQSRIDDYTVSTLMYMLPPRPLANHGGQFDGLYLITLVDERFYWQYQSATIAITKGMTWDTLISQLGFSLGMVPIYSPIESVYLSPEADSQFWMAEESSAVLLDAAAHNVGRVVIRGLDGTYFLLTALESHARVFLSRGQEQNVRRTAGGDIFYSGQGPLLNTEKTKNAVLPESVTVAFPKYVILNNPVPHFVNPRYQAQRPSAWYEDSFGDSYKVVVPLFSGDPTVISGMVGVGGYNHTIHSTAKALLSTEADTTPLNKSGLVGLSVKIASDFYSWQVASALDEVFPGTINWAPDGIHDIVWSYSAKTTHGSTRVLKTQWNQTISEMQHSTPPYVSGGLDTSGQLYLNPPGVGGHSVAQTIQDSFSGTVDVRLAKAMVVGDKFAIVTNVNYLPTQNRWRGQIGGVGSGIILPQVSNTEYVLFEGTSGGIPVQGGVRIDIAYRGIDGTNEIAHLSGDNVSQLNPNQTYGVNLVTFEKNQFSHPGVWSSGGIQETRIIPQTQSVQALTDGNDWLTFNGIKHFSGRIQSYKTANSSGSSFLNEELVWLVERNHNAVASGKVYDGQIAGYSVQTSGLSNSAPVYLVNHHTHQKLVRLLYNVVPPDNPEFGAPLVGMFDPLGGIGFAGYAKVSNGQVSQVIVTNGGSGYRNPIINIWGNTLGKGRIAGTGATATANLDSNGTVTSVTVNTPGTGYGGDPGINAVEQQFNKLAGNWEDISATGTGAVASANIVNGAMRSALISRNGTGYDEYTVPVLDRNLVGFGAKFYPIFKSDGTGGIANIKIIEQGYGYVEALDAFHFSRAMISVTTYGKMPLKEGDLVSVYQEAITGKWIPTTQILTDIVRIPNPGVLNNAGYQDGYVQVYDSTQPACLGWSDGPLVHVMDANC